MPQRLRLLAGPGGRRSTGRLGQGQLRGDAPVRDGRPVRQLAGHDELDPYQKAIAVYGEAKLARLMALKRRYDPANLFRVNHNIPVGRRGVA
jgi:hypothetical protein